MLYSRTASHCASAHRQQKGVATPTWRQLVSGLCKERVAYGAGSTPLGAGPVHLVPPAPPSHRVPFILGLARAGSLVALSLANDEFLAAAYPVSTDDLPSAASTSSSVSSKGSRSTVLASGSSLTLSSGSFVLPHPDKVLKGGEDWFFIAQNRRAIGVADGVGGWSEIGVDAGAYARELMNAAGKAADAATSSGAQLSPQAILEEAYTKTSARGSCTACIAVLLPAEEAAGQGSALLRVSNLGDSGALVLRGGKVVFHSPQQQHGFNFPYQIGSADSMSDLPQAAEQYEVAVQAGDVVVLGTDGLWDNCFDEEVSSVIKYCQEHGMGPEKTAQVMAHYARHRAADSKFASPFAYAAFQAGYAYMGGKMDDITVVIGVVEDAAASSVSAPAGGQVAAAAAAAKL